jgi:hypothetical protein
LSCCDNRWKCNAQMENEIGVACAGLEPFHHLENLDRPPIDLINLVSAPAQLFFVNQTFQAELAAIGPSFNSSNSKQVDHNRIDTAGATGRGIWVYKRPLATKQNIDIIQTLHMAIHFATLNVVLSTGFGPPTWTKHFDIFGCC